jgi:NCS2 family nucleobase:cation symporter-2
MIMSGLQIILSSKQDTRKTFVIGIPLIFGLSLQALPELYAQVVPWLRPLFGSALTLATVLAVVLNLLLRVGTRSEATSPISGEGGGNRHHPSTFVIAEASHS